MEIARFVHEEIQYIIDMEIRDFGDIKIPFPEFFITDRSSKKKRIDLPANKSDRTYSRIPLENPIGFFLKAYSILDDYLKDWNYVSFTAYKDSKDKRERVYKSGLERMGFSFFYKYECPWDKSWVEYFFARPGYEIKKKEIKKLIKSSYGSWKWNGEYWEEDI
jgi:hypothetical protein